MAIQRLSVNFRADILRDIHRHLEAGKCGTLIGVASCGKSRLVEFMGRPDAREHYLGEKWKSTLFPWVDGNDLLEMSEWGLYEKILHAILIQIEDSGIDGAQEKIEKVNQWYWKLAKPDNRHLARRLVGFALAELKDIRIVLLLDDFEKIFSAADESVFSGLRSLRDMFKKDNQYRVLYLCFSRKRLIRLRETVSPEFESFIELFKNFSRPIGCYSEDDALFMIQRLSEAYPLEGRIMTQELAQLLCEVTGGHAGLMDAAFHSKTEDKWGQGNLAKTLISAMGVWNECNSIWEGLDEDEQGALYAISCGQTPGEEAAYWLEKSGLIKRDTTGAWQCVELLRLFLIELLEITVDISLQHRTLIVEGNPVELTEREAIFCQVLYQARGQWCSHSELYKHLYSNHATSEFSRARTDIQVLAQRITNRVRQHCGGRSIIFHDSEHGYRMI